MFQIDQQSNNELLEKQVQSLFKATLSGGIANIGAALLVFTLLSGSRHETSAYLLSTGIFVISLLRIFVSNHYITKKKYALRTYLNAHVLLTLFIGMLWAVYIFIQHQPNDETARNVAYLINFGLIAGSITTLSTYRVAYLVYMLPQFIAIIAVYAIADTATSNYIAIAVLLSGIFMMSASFGINRSHKKEIQLIYNNKQLIHDLNSEIEIREKIQLELEDNKRKLETTVEKRTKDLVSTNIDLENVIKKKEKAEGSLQYLAYHDELTGLPNRNLLIDRINYSIEAARRNKQQLGVLFLDLDRFKTINDSLGHLIGDKLIKEVSNRLLKTLRKEDTISRNGGDEFVVVIQRMVSSEEVIGIAQKLIENVNEIFDIDSHKIHIGSSIGISLYPNDGGSAIELIRNADTAMFNAKKSGGNRLQFYDESMSNKLRERLLIESELHTAISNNEFYLVYQPQVNCVNGKTTGFEALLRWENNQLGLIGPNQFIPLMEEMGLIYDVGEWVLKNVVDFIHSGHVGDSVISMNLSALQCSDMSFIDFLQDIIESTGINPAQLEFEITESLLINDFEKTEIFLNKIHDLGCSIALDDFGTGYTSMSYLTRLPIDCIKIDQSFIRGIDSNHTLKNIVKAIVYMSKSLGMKNVFEGVETASELDVIKNLNGTIIQGYLFSKPLNVSAIENWMKAEHNLIYNRILS